MTLNFSPNPNGHYNLVVSPDGRQITMISTDKGDVLIANATRLEYRKPSTMSKKQSGNLDPSALRRVLSEYSPHLELVGARLSTVREQSSFGRHRGTVALYLRSSGNKG